MYDMYPWPENAAKADRDQARRPSAPPRATQAVQVALDRRDNGGDAAAEPTAVLARR
jgi:hypothetical protein